MKALEQDPDVIEIVQFGSPAYTHEYARDVGVLIITRNPRDYGVYLDAVEEEAKVVELKLTDKACSGKIREYMRGGFRSPESLPMKPETGRSPATSVTKVINVAENQNGC